MYNLFYFKLIINSFDFASISKLKNHDDKRTIEERQKIDFGEEKDNLFEKKRKKI